MKIAKHIIFVVLGVILSYASFFVAVAVSYTPPTEQKPIWTYLFSIPWFFYSASYRYIGDFLGLVSSGIFTVYCFYAIFLGIKKIIKALYHRTDIIKKF